MTPKTRYGRAMSERSEYLRDQAEKCRTHARDMTDLATQQELLSLATEYIMRAVQIETEERAGGSLH